MFKVEKIKNKFPYFIIVVDNKITIDLTIAKLIKLDVNFFRQYLIKEFNGVIDLTIDEIYFENEKDAKKAMEWIESHILISKLANEKDV